MKKYLSNLVNMIRATLLYCANNAAATAIIANFAAAKSALDTKLVLIDQLSQIANASTKGVTLDTNAIRKAMTDIAFKCCNALTAYAVSVNNNTLKQKVNFSKTALNRLKKDEIDDTCQTIHDEADLNIAAAGGFVEISPKQTPFFRVKLTPVFRSKLTPAFRSKLTPPIF
jgi:hypothetical protein